MLVSDQEINPVACKEPRRLNPCFSGCWSRTETVESIGAAVRFVLILVLVDVGLGPLVPALPPPCASASLNPCFSGCWSRTRPSLKLSNNNNKVLILVLVDVGLGHNDYLIADVSVGGS